MMLMCFVLVAADTVLRDDARVEVDALARISPREVPATASRKEDVQVITTTVARHDKEWAAVGYAVLSQAALDPLALCCMLVLAAYMIFHFVAPRPAEKDFERRPDQMSVASSRTRDSRTSGRSRAPDRFALVVNQKLTRLETVDEVLDFAVQSAETGRTDIVNAVTAIHRSAKLVASKPQLQRIRTGQDPRLHQLLGHLLRFLQEPHSAQTLSRAVGNTSWALAKLHYKEEAQDLPILEKLQEVFVEHAISFRPEELMNTVWAFAELRRDRDSAQGEQRVVLVAQAACRCVDKFPEFSLQQVVYLSWALARMSSIAAVKHDSSEVRAGLLEFARRIVERARPELYMLTTKNLAMLCWAVASLHANLGLVDTECGVTTLLTEVSTDLAAKGLQSFLPGEIASVVWAVNKVHVRVPAFFAVFQEHLLRKGLQGFSSQDISTILGAFVKTGCGSDELYKMLGARAELMAKDFNRSEKQLVLWAFTQLPHLDAPKL